LDSQGGGEEGLEISAGVSRGSAAGRGLSGTGNEEKLVNVKSCEYCYGYKYGPPEKFLAQAHQQQKRRLASSFFHNSEDFSAIS